MTEQRVHYEILVVGGGSAGITTAAHLAKLLPGGIKKTSMAILEPSDKHYYQPLWTLVGGGVYPKEVTERKEVDLIPKGATWVRDAGSEFFPDENYVLTASGTPIHYSYLVVAPGIQVDWGKIPGLAESRIGSSKM